MPRSTAEVDIARTRLPVWVAEVRDALVPSRHESALPRRVRELIVQNEIVCERLIGLVQLALVATFATLYLIAPRPFDAGRNGMAPVPIALSLYAVFTLGRLWLAHRGRLPGWLLAVSVVADVALLLALIWSFHFDYGQPPAFSLKVPTFVYIMVFIALRALSFEPRYVLAVGMTAAAGWVAMVVMVLSMGDEGVVTRNFVAYLTENKVLIGAEIDKVIALLLVTLVLAIACARGRRILVTAFREESAGRDMRRFLSSGIADVVTNAETQVQAGEAAERDAAILMLDIRGFTAFSAKEPPDYVVRMLIGMHARVLPAVQAHGGVVDKFLGDGVMVTFGAVTPSATAAADALRALDAVLTAAAGWQADLKAQGCPHGLELNAGLAAGRVVLATLGNGDRLEYTVIGDAVNLAAKLEKHNKQTATRALVADAAMAAAVAQGYGVEQEAGRDADDRIVLRDIAIGGVAGSQDVWAYSRVENRHVANAATG